MQKISYNVPGIMYMDISDLVKDTDLMPGLLMVRISLFVSVFHQNSRTEEEKVPTLSERDTMSDREVCTLHKLTPYWTSFVSNISLI